MAPIVVSAASSDEDTSTSLNLHGAAMSMSPSKDKLNNMGYVLRTPGGTLADTEEGRDEIDATASSSSSDDESLEDQLVDQSPKPFKYKRQQSNLFSDENKIGTGVDMNMMDQFPSPGITQTSYLGNHNITPSNDNNNNDLHAPPSSAFMSGGLSLMPSFSPSSSQDSSPTPSSPGLEDINIGTPLGRDYHQQPLFDHQQPLFDESQWIQSQIDNDEELARQLQDEEDAKKKKFTPKSKSSKPKPQPSLVDSIFGEPLRFEMKANYVKVEKKGSTNNNSARGSSTSSTSDLPDSVSSGISMLTTSFSRWGSSMTAAATDFFGEDVNMQVRSSGNSRGCPSSRFRNEV